MSAGPTHTPGPWFWQKARTRFHLMGGPHRLGLAVESHTEGSAEHAANLLVIAAATDMLVALEGIRTALHAHTPAMPQAALADICPAMDAVSAAIAKARGTP